MTSNFKSLTFCFPHRAPNGVSNSFIRVIEKLLEHNIQIKIRVIDYFDSFLFKAITERNMTQVELLPFENDKPIKINNDTILILQASLPDQIPKELNINDDTKIYFWALHQFNFCFCPPILYEYLASNEKLHKFYLIFKYSTKVKNFINI